MSTILCVFITCFPPLHSTDQSPAKPPSRPIMRLHFIATLALVGLASAAPLGAQTQADIVARDDNTRNPCDNARGMRSSLESFVALLTQRIKGASSMLAGSPCRCADFSILSSCMRRSAGWNADSSGQISLPFQITGRTSLLNRHPQQKRRLQHHIRVPVI